MIRPMDEGLKDWIQALAWIATAAGIIFTALKFVSEMGALSRQRKREVEQREADVRQRKADLRWRQAEAGKSLNDEMQTDERAWPAMQMLDSPERKYKIDGESVTIERGEVASALDVEKCLSDEKSVYIRDCFDTLFYFMAMMNHYIARELIVYEDVAYPIEYYVNKLEGVRREALGYLKQYELRRTLEFLTRYDAWKADAEAALENLGKVDTARVSEPAP